MWEKVGVARDGAGRRPPSPSSNARGQTSVTRLPPGGRDRQPAYRGAAGGRRGARSPGGRGARQRDDHPAPIRPGAGAFTPSSARTATSRSPPFAPRQHRWRRPAPSAPRRHRGRRRPPEVAAERRGEPVRHGRARDEQHVQPRVGAASSSRGSHQRGATRRRCGVVSRSLAPLYPLLYESLRSSPPSPRTWDGPATSPPTPWCRRTSSPEARDRRPRRRPDRRPGGGGRRL